MARWQPSGAQQAVDIVAAVMAGQPSADVRVELDHWLGRRAAVLPEPLLSRTVAAIAGGRRVVVLPTGATADPPPGRAARDVDVPERALVAAHPG